MGYGMQLMVLIASQKIIFIFYIPRLSLSLNHPLKKKFQASLGTKYKYCKKDTNIEVLVILYKQGDKGAERKVASRKEEKNERSSLSNIESILS